MSFGKFIFECDEENIVLAGKAAKHLLRDPSKSDCWMAYGDDEQIEMYARRLKRSISVKQGEAMTWLVYIAFIAALVSAGAFVIARPFQ